MAAFAAVALLGTGLAACSSGTTGSTTSPGTGPMAVEPNATVVSVVDGDTLVVAIDDQEERVRLIGMDTPESVAPNRPVECYGKEASDRMGDLVPPGTAIRLERDIEARDMYGRLLAYVYRASDGLHVNLNQVEQGYAEAMPYPPNTALQQQFSAAEREARAGNAGLWAACGSADVPIAPPPTQQTSPPRDDARCRGLSREHVRKWLYNDRFTSGAVG